MRYRPQNGPALHTPFPPVMLPQKTCYHTHKPYQIRTRRGLRFRQPMTQPDPPSYDQQAYGPGIALVARLGASVSVSCNYQLPQHHARRAGERASGSTARCCPSPCRRSKQPECSRNRKCVGAARLVARFCLSGRDRQSVLHAQHPGNSEVALIHNDCTSCKRHVWRGQVWWTRRFVMRSTTTPSSPDNPYPPRPHSPPRAPGCPTSTPPCTCQTAP